jgi:carbamoyltransferase
MIILGINSFHGDSSACLVRNGKLVAAAEEERFCRIKHWAGFPSEAISYCLTEAGISLADVDHVAINQDTTANLWKKILFSASKRPDLGMVLDRIKNKRERANLLKELKESFGAGFRGELHQIEHHLAHLSSAFHVSPFEKSVVVSIDGFGDFASAAWGLGSDCNITIDDKVYFPHSLGIFYQALTQFLGFPHFGDEYKVMGLAPYGEPNFINEMRKIVLLQGDGSFKLNLDFFLHDKEKVEHDFENGVPTVGPLYSQELVRLLGPVREKGEKLTQRHKNIARSVQVMYEEAFFHLLNILQKQHNCENLCLAGGCAMNSVANGKVYRNTQFKKIYIQSASGDAGGAMGAAFTVWHKLGGKRDFNMDHSYWGPSFTDEEIGLLIDKQASNLIELSFSVLHVSDENSLCYQTAAAVAEGQVVGWFQGRMEWGPRALGNRSILGDPRRSEMKDILNLKIKRRESFRPFAPSILRESVLDWFEHDDDVPFMMQVYPIRKEKQALIPAVTHVDGTGRLQTVASETNPRYHKLISTFGKITGVPILLNTSFNENEPVVCKPEEALNCFLRTKMDVLILGNWIIRRTF